MLTKDLEAPSIVTVAGIVSSMDSEWSVTKQLEHVVRERMSLSVNLGTTPRSRLS